MRLIAEEIVSRCGGGEGIALCVVVATRGSTPQSPGAKMLVLADGQTLGTLGGGCVEAEVRKQALELLASGKSKALRFSLDHDYGWDDGLICGGVMDVFVDVLREHDAERYEKIADALALDQSAVLEFRYSLGDGVEKRYSEDLGSPPVLLIAGAGHVGQALAKLAVDLDFRVDVMDDRADFLNVDRFPHVRACIAGDIESSIRAYPINADTYVVLVTRGHKNDGRALAAVAGSPAKYVGLIGSKRKVKTILYELSRAGVDREWLKRVHAPIGLDLGSVTVQEIAISIAAELIAVRRGRDVASVEMRIDGPELDRWLDRK